MAAAKTRIYGDGSQFTKALYADGGEIGGFKIYSDRIVAGDYDSGSDEMRLYKSLLRFRSPKTGSEVSIGTSVLPSSVGGVSCPMYVDNSEMCIRDRDYVELSKSDADGSASPEAGDEIAQFGNRSDITRQSAIVIDPLDGGSVEVYAHIDAYSLSEKNYVGMGVNPQTGRCV